MIRRNPLMTRLSLTHTAWLYNMRRMMRLFVPTMSHPLADQSNSLSCQPLIIVSSGRSGTTLLRSMLVMGGDIAMPPENEVLPMMMMQYTAMQEVGWANLARMIPSFMEISRYYDLWNVDFNQVYKQARALPKDEQSLARLIDLIYCHYATTYFPAATIWGDQTPDNIFYYQWFLDVFPKAKYLHVLRDGRDVVSSMLRIQEFTLETAMAQWNSAVTNAIKLKKSIPAEQFLEIRYRDLASEPEQILQSVCDFAGIQYKPVMFDFWQSTTTVEHQKYAHHKNLAKPISTASVGRWRERLTDEQQTIVQKELAEMLAYYEFT